MVSLYRYKGIEDPLGHTARSLVRAGLTLGDFDNQANLRLAPIQEIWPYVDPEVKKLTGGQGKTRPSPVARRLQAGHRDTDKKTRPILQVRPEGDDLVVAPEPGSKSD